MVVLIWSTVYAACLQHHVVLWDSGGGGFSTRPTWQQVCAVGSTEYVAARCEPADDVLLNCEEL